MQQDGNIGRTDLLVGGLVGYTFGSMTAVLSAKTPVWQQFIRPEHQHDGDPGQLKYPAIINMAFQYTFGDAQRAGKIVTNGG